MHSQHLVLKYASTLSSHSTACECPLAIQPSFVMQCAAQGQLFMSKAANVAAVFSRLHKLTVSGTHITDMRLCTAAGQTFTLFTMLRTCTQVECSLSHTPWHSSATLCMGAGTVCTAVHACSRAGCATVLYMCQYACLRNRCPTKSAHTQCMCLPQLQLSHLTLDNISIASVIAGSAADKPLDYPGNRCLFLEQLETITGWACPAAFTRHPKLLQRITSLELKDLFQQARIYCLWPCLLLISC